MARRAASWSGHAVGRVFLLITLVSACNEEPVTAPGDTPEAAKAAAGPTITSTNPFSAPRDTTLDVQVLGTGFDQGSKAEFPLHGVVGPNIRTNRTTYKSSKELVANITISTDAIETAYDVAVTTASGKKGIGTEAFTVLPIELLGTNALGEGVNSSGTVVGYTPVPTTCGGASNRPVVWTETGGFRQLPVPTGTCNGAARGINDAGIIIGSVNNTAYHWLPDPGGETWVPQSLGVEGSPQGINRAGDIALLHDNGNIANLIWQGTLWIQGTGIVYLQDLPGSTHGCLSKGINNLQQVVGRCQYAENNRLTPVVWSSPSAVPIHLPELSGVTRYDVEAINDAGVIVGMGITSSGAHVAVRWVPSGGSWVVERLGTLGGDSEAKAINNRNQIVGLSRVGGTTDHAFVWVEGSGMRDLGTLGSQGSQAWGINDPIVGSPALAAGWSYVSATPQMVRWRVE